MKSALRFSSALLIAVLISACGSLGLQAPKDFGDQWEYAQRQSIGLRQGCARALEMQTMEVAKAKECREIADKADSALDMASLAHSAGDLATAEARLRFAQSILLELERKLSHSNSGDLTNERRRPSSQSDIT